MEHPAIALEGQLRHVSTMGDIESCENEINPEGSQIDDEYPNLRACLRGNESDCAEDGKKYWPDKLLREIMTRNRIIEELDRIRSAPSSPSMPKVSFKHDTNWYMKRFLPSTKLDLDFEYGAHNCVKIEEDTSEQLRANFECYLKIFTLLLICERYQDLDKFIDAQLCDNDLPLDFTTPRSGRPTPVKCSEKKIACFSGWPITALERFQSEQYHVLTPYFPYDSKLEFIRHVSYCPEAIMPWKKVKERCENGGYKYKYARGGYGLIECIRLHPYSHGFHGIHQVEAAKGKFALKHITTGNTKDFENESRMLRIFSNHHDHFVRLLMTFSFKDSNYLLFPWADCDLESYWERESPPFNPSTNTVDHGKVKWLSKQICGLVEALDIIHNPENLALLGTEKRYARHGDLKPQNILWFKSNPSKDGILVIGDLGISSAHREESRSNIPNHNLPVSPDYRPPECDQKGGKISRSFDIWTLGCLLLEMVCWALGGNDLKNKFEKERSRVPYLGISSNIYFDVKMTTSGGAAIMVKEVVVQWMSDLHEKPGCTEYFHELLHIIHDDMILVLSKDTARIRSKPLLRKLKELHHRLNSLGDGQEPQLMKWQYSQPVAVATSLNENAAERFNSFRQKITRYKGELKQAKTPDEMEQMELDS